jgi:modulator of FtsH protease
MRRGELPNLNVTAGWSNFLSAETGAAATLAGLIFVAVSINLSKILEYPGVPGRAAEALALLMGVLFVCTFGLAPYQSERSLGIEFLAVGGLLWLMTVILAVGELRRKHPWQWLVSRFMLSQGATLSFCVAGIALILSHPNGMYWLIPGCVFSFVASISSAWVLLIEILR